MPRSTRFYAMAILATVPICIALSAANAGDKVVATVNGVAIQEEALFVEINKILPMSSFHARVSDEKLQEIRQQALRNLIEEELLYQEARKNKIVVSGDELEKQIRIMKSGYPSDEAFEQNLRKSGLSRSRFRKQIHKRLMVRQILQREVNAKVAVNDSDLQQYYLANKEKFILPKQYRVRHILISVAPGAMAAGWQSGLKETQAIHARILAGSDFARVAKEYSADTTSNEQGGDLGWIHQGQFIPELEEAVDALQIGGITKPVRTIYGYHILKLEGIRPEKQLTFDQVNLEMLQKRLLKKRLQERKTAFIASLAGRANIRIFDP